MSWLGALPQGAFPVGQMQTAAPFVWGRGGARMTPEQIAMQREIALRETQGDYSPIGHWTQGLGRVLDGVSGGLRNRRIAKAEAANAAEGDAVMRVLMVGGSMPGASGGAIDESGATKPANEHVIAAMLNPNLPESVREFAKMQYKQMQPKPPPEPTEFERSLIASGILPGTPEWTAAFKSKVQNTLDPWTNIVVGGNSYSGRQSMVDNALKGGGPASAGPGGATPPSTLPPDFDFGKGGPTPTASGRFPR